MICAHCHAAPKYRYASGLPLCIDCYYGLSISTRTTNQEYYK